MKNKLLEIDLNEADEYDIEPSKIAKATLEDIKYYDKVAMENSSICK